MTLLTDEHSDHRGSKKFAYTVIALQHAVLLFYIFGDHAFIVQY